MRGHVGMWFRDVCWCSGSHGHGLGFPGSHPIRHRIIRLRSVRVARTLRIGSTLMAGRQARSRIGGRAVSLQRLWYSISLREMIRSGSFSGRNRVGIDL
jgi:hypothetical protein